MTNVSSLGAAIALVASSIALPAPAQAQETWIVDFCRTEILPDPIFAGATLGECVAYNQTLFNAEDHGFPTLDCHAFRKLEPEAFYLEYDTFGECVIENE